VCIRHEEVQRNDRHNDRGELDADVSYTTHVVQREPTDELHRIVVSDGRDVIGTVSRISLSYCFWDWPANMRS
jgi:hypothetical protein